MAAGKESAGGREEAEVVKEEELDADIELADMAACWTSIFSLQGETAAESKVCMAGLAAAVLLASSPRYAKGWRRPSILGFTTRPLLSPFIALLDICSCRGVLALPSDPGPLGTALAPPWRSAPRGPARPACSLLVPSAKAFSFLMLVSGGCSSGYPRMSAAGGFS